MRLIILIILIILITAFLLPSLLLAQAGKYETGAVLKKTSFQKHYSKMNINNVSTFIYNNGYMDIDYVPNIDAGFEFPAGSEKNVFFQSGLLYGAFVNGQLRVGGSNYSSSLQPGRIIEPGVSENPETEDLRVYRVRPDYLTADLSNEINDGEGTEDEIRHQYEIDWQEWPAEKGAPFNDVDNNNVYNPATDIPGIPGADQTSWFVANDLNEELSLTYFNSFPLGVEIQVTNWGYIGPGALYNTIFKKYKIINKSDDSLNDMYFSIWSDPDIGWPMDDFVGVDTTLDLFYAYNSENPDNQYNELQPAAGFCLLQGPVVEGAIGDIAIKDGKYFSGKKNLSASSFMYFNSVSFCDDVYDPYTNNLNWYNAMQALYPCLGYPLINPNGDTTKFMVNGNPVNGTGWVDGTIEDAGDRSGIISTGPINMQPGDTVEIVYAQIAAMGRDRINSIEVLKDYAFQIRDAYNKLVLPPAYSTPPTPEIYISEENEGIRIGWDRNAVIVSYNKDGYNFQGFNLYQLKGSYPLIESGYKIATFDFDDGVTNIPGLVYDGYTDGLVLKNIQTGTDSGLEYSIRINKDYETGGDLIKGKQYNYALSSYTFKNDQSLYRQSTESPVRVNSVNYHKNLAGVNYLDKIEINHLEGEGFADIDVVVDNPSTITDHNYRIEFTPQDSISLTWSLKDVDLNQYKIENASLSQVPYDYDSNLFDYYFVDGLRLKVAADLEISKKPTNVFLNNNPGTRELSYFSFRQGNIRIYDPGYLLDSYTQNLGENLGDDFEIRFSGIIDTLQDGTTLVREGTGSVATVWQIREHVLNPNPGSLAPFTYRVPWGIWNINENRQVNTIYISYRPASFMEIPAESGRFYILDNDYTEEVIDVENALLEVENRLAPYLFYNWQTGDVIRIEYSDRVYNDIYSFNSGIITSSDLPETPVRFNLGQNYPNPFNPITTIEIQIPEYMFLKLEVFDILGRKVATVADGEMDMGNHRLQFDASKLASGVYLYVLKSKNYTKTKKMLLLK